MIKHPAFTVEPWALHETELHFGTLAQTESLFALSNGHIGWRGNLDEGEPYGLPGSYLNGFFEHYPLPYAERGYGFPESGQTLVNVTNGKLVRLLVDDEPLDIRQGELRSHTRVLDFRAGTLTRSFTWTSPAGRSVRVTSTRLVSFTHRAIAAVAYRVEALDGPLRVLLQSELVANEKLPPRGEDPREAVRLEAPLISEHHACTGTLGLLLHRTARSGARLAAAMDHVVNGSQAVHVSCQSAAQLARIDVADQLEPGRPLELIKFVAYGWTREARSATALEDQVAAALETAQLAGFDGLCAEQRRYLDGFWQRADVELEGDVELQQAVRFGLFHVLQAAARAERSAIPAKGLTGPGYDGHSFWDTEIFVLPLLVHGLPSAAADALRWRHGTLETAERRARALGLAGAAFPWRTINGEECSGYWPAGTAAFHVNADIADAIVRYVRATGDREFERELGIEVLVQTARLWRSLGHYGLHGEFCIDGVTGPDEYSALGDNNVYTNLMAQRNLRAAAQSCERHRSEARALAVSLDEMAEWRAAADRMRVPYNAELGVHEQAERFTEHALWDFANTRPDQYPLLLHVPYFDLYRKQVVKQPDLVLAMQLCSDAFTREQKLRNFCYYERITVRDSSLSACTQAVLAAEVGQLRLALDYAAEAALIDLENFQHNARDGLHLASLAGAWSALVAGFGGMRDHAGTLSFAPRLPDGIARLSFRLQRASVLLRVSVAATTASYALLEGAGPLELLHHGEPIILRDTNPVERAIPPLPATEPVEQPPGREPRRHVRSAVRQRPPRTGRVEPADED